MTLLEAVDQYPSWHPTVVKSVDVLERNEQGRATKARAKLHVQHGPLTRDFDLTMDVQVDPAGTVKLSRIPHHGADDEKFDVIWRVSGDGPTQIRLDLAANLNVPRFLPLGDVGESLAAGFVNAATTALT
jgi:Polyketide cyclase / dehydrase and lipid transport